MLYVQVIYKPNFVLLQCLLLALYLNPMDCTINEHFEAVLLSPLQAQSNYCVWGAFTLLESGSAAARAVSHWLPSRTGRYLILFPVLNLIHCGIGLFCLAFLAKTRLILNVFCDGCTHMQSC